MMPTVNPARFSRDILVALRFTGVSVLGAGLAWPLLATALAGVLFPFQARGSLVEVDGRVVGSQLVSQPFAASGYLFGRPSPCGHDPRALAGSNLATSNPALRERVAADSAAAAAREGVSPSTLPPELLAASGSCIDPHLSPAAAAVQVARIAAARGLDPDRVRDVLTAHTEGTGPWSLGGPRVHVLGVNLALDGLPTPR